MSDVDRAISIAAQAQDAVSLWAALEPLRPMLLDDERVAHAWCSALSATPSRPSLVSEAQSIAERWPQDPAIAGAACDALIRAAERRPIDEPPLNEGPASIAASIADRCRAALSQEKQSDPEIGGRLWALRANALRLMGPLRLDDALEAIGRALELDPDRGEWHFDLGLVHKQRRDFRACLEHNRRACAKLGDRKAVLWNLAIAATACGEGEEAAAAWRALGIEASASDGTLPFVEGLTAARVRLPTLGPGHGIDLLPERAAGFEIVWVQPLSPCHGVIRSPTFRDAAADFGDVVLWDGAPVGVSEQGPIFALLSVLARGDERRMRVLALQQRAGQIEEIARALEPDALLYVHGERVEVACPRCAAGELLVRHEHLPAEEHRIAIAKLIAPGSLDLRVLDDRLRAAREANPGVLLAVPALYELLGDTPEAGKHHKRWGSIERVGARKNA